MKTSEAFIAITKHSFDLVIYAWPITAVIVLLALIALLIGSPFRNPKFRKWFPIILMTYIIPIVVVTIGAMFRYKGPTGQNWVEPPSWYGIVLYAVILFHAIMLISAAIFIKGLRARSIALLMPALWLSASAWFIASIAIAGVGP